jgi:SAM-dependent methyltransferase
MPQLWNEWRDAGVFEAELTWLARVSAHFAEMLRLMPGPDCDDGAAILYPDAERPGHLAGAVRCAEAELPFADDSLRMIVLQHALDMRGASPALLRECIRVLAPGGELSLFCLNPVSPWWWRRRASDASARRHLRPSLPARRRQLLRQLGLTVVRSIGLGPRWHPAGSTHAWSESGDWRAVVALRAIKSAATVIPLRPRRPAFARGNGALVPTARAIEVAA